MAFITVPSIKIGDEIKFETFDDFINEVNAVSPSGINAENIRDEGIDRRNLASSSVQFASNLSSYNYQSNLTHYIPKTHPNFFQITTSPSGGTPIEVGYFECAAGEWIFIGCSFSFECDGVRTNHPNNTTGAYELRFRLMWEDIEDGYFAAPMNGTERHFSSTLMCNGSNATKANLRYSCTIVSAVKPSAYRTTNSGNHNIKVKLQGMALQSLDSSAVTEGVINSVSMHGRVIKR